MKEYGIFLIVAVLISVAGATAYTDYLRSDIEYNEVTTLEFNEKRYVGDRPVMVIATIHFYSDGSDTSMVRSIVNGQEVGRKGHGLGMMSKGNAKIPITFIVPANGWYSLDPLQSGGDGVVTIHRIMEAEM